MRRGGRTPSSPASSPPRYHVYAAPTILAREPEGEHICLLERDLKTSSWQLKETYGFSFKNKWYSEITESTVLTPGAATVDALRRLAIHGVRIAIDDFGMGHTSLRYLNELQVNTIKLDRSLTEQNRERVNDHIVRSIVELSKPLEITVIAEGIEDVEQLNRFRGLGCEVFQGYFFSKPLSSDACLMFIQSRIGQGAGDDDLAENVANLTGKAPTPRPAGRPQQET